MKEENVQSKPSGQQQTGHSKEPQGKTNNQGSAERANASNEIGREDHEEGSMNNGESGGAFTEDKSPH